MKKAAGAINTNGLHTDTNGFYFHTCEAEDQAQPIAIAPAAIPDLSLPVPRPPMVLAHGQRLSVATNVIADRDLNHLAMRSLTAIRKLNALLIAKGTSRIERKVALRAAFPLAAVGEHI